MSEQGDTIAFANAEVILVGRNPRVFSDFIEEVDNLSCEWKFIGIRGDITDRVSVDSILSLGVCCIFYSLPQSLSSSDMISVSHMLADSAIQYRIQHIVRLSSYGSDDFLFDPNKRTQGPLD